MHLNGSGLPSPVLILIIPPTNQILTTLSLLRSLFSELATITTRHHESPQAEAWQLMDFLYPKLLNHLAQNLMAIPPWPKHQAPAAKGHREPPWWLQICFCSFLFVWVYPVCIKSVFKIYLCNVKMALCRWMLCSVFKMQPCSMCVRNLCSSMLILIKLRNI